MQIYGTFMWLYCLMNFPSSSAFFGVANLLNLPWKPPKSWQNQTNISLPTANIPLMVQKSTKNTRDVEQNPVLLVGGGFKHFYFHPLFGEDSHFDSYFSTGLKPPTSVNFVGYLPYQLVRLPDFWWTINSMLPWQKWRFQGIGGWHQHQPANSRYENGFEL